MSRILLKAITILFALVILTGLIPSEAGQSAGPVISADAPVIEARLFKNGIVMVTRKFTAGREGGNFFIHDFVFNPVHGTIWVQSDSDVQFRTHVETTEKKGTFLNGDRMLKYLAGKNVELTLNNSDKKITGKVLDIPGTVFSDKNILAISTNEGTEFIETGTIRLFKVPGTTISGNEKEFAVTEKVQTSGIMVSVGPSSQKQDIIFSYLTRGMLWAPDYLLEIKDDDDAVITMQASIRNELIDMEDAELYLISGFPAIEYEHVSSLLSYNVDLNRFFSALSSASGIRGRSAVMGQMAISSNMAMEAPETYQGSQEMSDGYDIYYQGIGKQSMKRETAFLTTLAESPVRISRVVEWNIYNNRDQLGRYQSDSNPEQFQEDMWDILKFKNPFKFPMTTAPIAIYQKGGFYGQSTSYWTPAGEEAGIKVTKALNIRTKHTEREIPGERETVSIKDYKYRKALVEGKIEINNLRNKTQHLLITRNFSGRLVSSEGKPEVTLLAEGVSSVNELSRLRWDIDLKPGEKNSLKYVYEVLVRL